MSDRRKLEAAIGLTEQQKRFIGGDAPRASQDSDAGASSNPESRPAALSGGILVPITTRLQPLTAHLLRRAILQQRLAGRTPATVQEICEVAISRWLREQGFWEEL
ncbi:MAG: hypothetical protein ACK6EB_15675 [Planctomyces sp.]